MANVIVTATMDAAFGSIVDNTDVPTHGTSRDGFRRSPLATPRGDGTRSPAEARSPSLVSTADSTNVEAADGQTAAAWVPDDRVQDCCVCFERFCITRWRHHCRICGGVVCRECSESRVFMQEAALTSWTVPRPLQPGKLARACNTCVTAGPRLKKAFSLVEDLTQRLDGIRPVVAGTSFQEKPHVVRRPGDFTNPQAVPNREDMELLFERMENATIRLENSWKAFEKHSGPPRSHSAEILQEFRGASPRGSAEASLLPPHVVENRCTAKCAIM